MGALDNLVLLDRRRIRGLDALFPGLAAPFSLEFVVCCNGSGQ